MVYVDATELEEARGAVGVSDHRKELGEGSGTLALFDIGDHVARVPAQERRGVAGPQRRHAEGADLALRQLPPGLGIDHLDEEQIAPDVDAVMRVALGPHQTGLAHAEHVVDLGPPHARELLALGLREGLGRAGHVANAA